MRQFVGALRNDARRVFISRGFIIAVFLLGTITFFCKSQGIYHALSILFNESIGHDDFAVIRIVAVTLPCAGMFYQDWHSKNFWMQVSREGKNVYAWSKIIVCAISGGMVAVLGRVLMFAYGFMCGYQIMEPAYSIETDVFWRDIFIVNNDVLLFFVAALIPCLMIGAVYAVFGLCISSFIPNPFVAYFIPYLLYMLELIVPESFPQSFLTAYIEMGYAVHGNLADNLMHAILLPLVYIVILGLVFERNVGRRVAK